MLIITTYYEKIIQKSIFEYNILIYCIIQIFTLVKIWMDSKQNLIYIYYIIL